MSLTDDFMPALSFAAVVAKDSSLASADHESVRQDLERLLGNALSNARKRGMQHPENALFGACAFADEVLLASTWPGRNEWLRHPLQQVHFNTTNAGEEFYQRLSRLFEHFPAAEDDALDGSGQERDQHPITVTNAPARPEAKPSDHEHHRSKSEKTASLAKAGAGHFLPADGPLEIANVRETLELYLTCLALGFKGRYFHNKDQSVIAKHLKDGLSRLGKNATTTSEAIFPELYVQRGLDSDQHSWFSRRVVLMYFILAAAAGILVYAGLFARMSFFVATGL